LIVQKSFHLNRCVKKSLLIFSAWQEVPNERQAWAP